MMVLPVAPLVVNDQRDGWEALIPSDYYTDETFKAIRKALQSKGYVKITLKRRWSDNVLLSDLRMVTIDVLVKYIRKGGGKRKNDLKHQ